MAHTHDHGTTVVEDTSSSSLLAVILIVALVALLVWFIGFSGIVIDRNDDAPRTDRTEIREENDSDTTIIQPGTDTDTGTQPNQPAQSPAP